MSKTKTAKKSAKRRRPASREEAVGMLLSVQKRQRQKEAEYSALEREFRDAQDKLVDAMVEALTSVSGRMREKLGEMHELASGAEKLSAIVSSADQASAFEKIKVDDPLMTQAEIVEQRRKWPDAHDIGKLTAKANVVTLLGGFARFEKRSNAQTAAAIKLLSLYERAQLRTDRATDYSAPVVDTSRRGDSDSVIVSTEQARAELDGARELLGADRYRIVIDVVAHCVSARKLAGPKAGSREVGRIAEQVRNALDALALHWHLAGIPIDEKRRLLGWDDGSPAVYTGVVVNPRRTKAPEVSR